MAGPLPAIHKISRLCGLGETSFCPAFVRVGLWLKMIYFLCHRQRLDRGKTTLSFPYRAGPSGMKNQLRLQATDWLLIASLSVAINKLGHLCGSVNSVRDSFLSMWVGG
jgi:hypothetical protein